MDKPMDETDRKHCLLDLHGIRERISPEAGAVEFVRRWGPQLESILAETPEDDRDEEMVDASDFEAEKDRRKTLESAVEDALDEVKGAIASLEGLQAELEKVSA